MLGIQRDVERRREIHLAVQDLRFVLLVRQIFCTIHLDDQLQKTGKLAASFAFMGGNES